MRRTVKSALAALAIVAGLAGPVTAFARPPEPAPVAEAVPAAPGPGYAWVPGHWDWHPFQHEYSWEPGYWATIAPPAPVVYRGWWRPAVVVRPAPLVVHRTVVVPRPVHRTVIVHRR